MNKRSVNRQGLDVKVINYRYEWTRQKKETNLDSNPTVETRVCTNNEQANIRTQESAVKNVEEIAVKKGKSCRRGGKEVTVGEGEQVAVKKREQVAEREKSILEKS